MENDITDKHTYDKIHHWHHEIQATDRTKLAGHIRALRRQVAEDTSRAQDDARALAHDRKLFPTRATNYRGEPRWQGSKAETMLKLDVKSQKQKMMLPEDFYASRPEYKEFSEDVIRQHIYQEMKLQTYFTWRNEKKSTQFIRFNN